MSDLISRSELLKEIEKYKFGAISNDEEREYIKKTILDFIVCQPTAYDIDKVVEELESAENYYYDDKLDEEGDLVMFKSIEQSVAIEIVKQGGVGKDVE